MHSIRPEAIVSPLELPTSPDSPWTSHGPVVRRGYLSNLQLLFFTGSRIHGRQQPSVLQHWSNWSACELRRIKAMITGLPTNAADAIRRAIPGRLIHLKTAVSAKPIDGPFDLSDSHDGGK